MRAHTVLAFALATLVSASAFAERIVYTVEYGDMLGSIAEEHNVSVDQLRRWNELEGDNIREGQELVIYPGSRASSSRASGGSSFTHTVAGGETLGAIAAEYDCTVADIVGWNRGLNPDVIREGQELRIRRRGRATRRVSYRVESGDNLGRIASRFDVTMAEIEGWNPGLDRDFIRIGQEIELVLEGPETPSESVGRASGGTLVNGEKLPPHGAYVIRNENIAWGTNETIGAILDGFDYMEQRFDRLPRVRVHDLSDEDGGPLRGHRSHQSGRDADIGYYHDRCRGECAYAAVRADEIDAERQWALFRYWIDNDLVEYVFVDYSYQEVLYDYAESEGASAAQLRSWFQYPSGRDVARGILRHEPNHRDHFHIRFSCDRDDASCR